MVGGRALSLKKMVTPSRRTNGSRIPIHPTVFRNARKEWIWSVFLGLIEFDLGLKCKVGKRQKGAISCSLPQKGIDNYFTI
jgi:hypothetical protein